MGSDSTNLAVGNFIVRHAKMIVTSIVFVAGLYFQHQASMMKIEQMDKEIALLKIQVDDQYAKLDEIKLDKVVFDATMKQFAEMSTDIRQIRDRLEDILGDHERHNPRQR